jgi:hypothetical protein
MKVDHTKLAQKLIAAAKLNPPRDQVPYAFERRIMARIKASPRLDDWAQWAAALWRGAVPCVAITMMLSAWSFFASNSTLPSSDLSQEIENTVLAAVDQEPVADSAW